MDDGVAPAADMDIGAASVIPDVTEVPIETLLDSDDSVLSETIRRLVLELNQQAESYAAHSTST